MHRAVTAIYRSFATASLVRDELERLGLAHRHITVLPDTATVPDTTDPTRSTTTASGDLDDAFESLHDLHLPESDTRTYQQALRQGDIIVSVSLGASDDLAVVEQIMRRPEESYDLNDLDNRYRGADYMPRRTPLAADHDERYVGRRSDQQLSPYTRHYQRDVPYSG